MAGRNTPRSLRYGARQLSDVPDSASAISSRTWAMSTASMRSSKASIVAAAAYKFGRRGLFFNTRRGISQESSTTGDEYRYHRNGCGRYRWDRCVGEHSAGNPLDGKEFDCCQLRPWHARHLDIASFNGVLRAVRFGERSTSPQCRRRPWRSHAMCTHASCKGTGT